MAVVDRLLDGRLLNVAQRRNYSAAAKWLFRYQKNVPKGGYPTAGALYQFLHAHQREFFTFLEAQADQRGVKLSKA